MITALVIIGYVLAMVIVGRVIVIPFAKREFGSVDSTDAPFVVMLSFFWPVVLFAATFIGIGLGVWQLMTMNIPNPAKLLKRRHKDKLSYEELLADIERRERELEMNKEEER